MSRPLAPRHYTDATGRIHLSAIKVSAQRWHMPQGRAHSRREGTLRGQIAHALMLAYAERDRFEAHPMRLAIDQTDAAITAYCDDGRCDSILREAAIVACHDRRPAMICTSPRMTYAMLAAEAVHRGEPLATWLLDQAAQQFRDLEAYADLVLRFLVPLNTPGHLMIARAERAVRARLLAERMAA